LKALIAELEIKINTGPPIPGFKNNLEMVELHMDSHPSSYDKMNAATEFGGNLSVQMSPNNRPLICFGQDECIIFKQSFFTVKAWTLPDGQKPIIRKEEGLGVGIRYCLMQIWI
jgi:hypothetical protein